MPEPTLTREAWRYLIKSAYGLKGVADTLDESAMRLIGKGPMRRMQGATKAES